MPSNNRPGGGEEAALLAPEVVSGREALPAGTLPANPPPHGPQPGHGRADDQDEQVGRGLLLDRRPRRGGVQRLPGPAGQERRRAPPTTTSTSTTATAPPWSPWACRCIDGIRQMAMTATDPHSLGRNFSGHFASRDWNVVPVTSVIEVQYAMAPGTALVQKRHGGDGITIVTGGDAGTAEGDFASCLVWSTRPGQRAAGADGRHEQRLGHLDAGLQRSTASSTSSTAARRSASPARWWTATTRSPAGTPSSGPWTTAARERRPYMLEAMVSRLYGHSSSSGALRVKGEPDCIELFEQQAARGRRARPPTPSSRSTRRPRPRSRRPLEQALREPQPTAGGRRAATPTPRARWMRCIPGDYTGLPLDRA